MMAPDLKALAKYRMLVFDCDGVVLDSNQVKIQAYYDTAMAYGATPVQAQALVDHHIALGGISRYPKFEYFLRTILQQTSTETEMQRLLGLFAAELEHSLLACAVAPGLEQLRTLLPDTRWMMISGGDQEEVRGVMHKRGLADYFDAGIYGSPDNKDTILAREIASGALQTPAIFFGDSRYDHQSSTRAGLDFVFLSDWTDVPGWQDYCSQHHICIMQRLDQLLR
ncbi:HAD family hydrolase [Methylobacillus flagellatus]|uniref:HAD family hydrolase n=1 Tax=Methylobacillus flagellatus TaxID=405 RepID=UPI00336AB3F7